MWHPKYVSLGAYQLSNKTIQDMKKLATNSYGVNLESYIHQCKFFLALVN